MCGVDMSQQLLLICLLGGVVASDTTAAFQMLISHPLVACTLAGVVLQNVQLGLSLGILLELLWMAEVPVGGVRTNESNVGALVATTVLITLSRAVQRPELLLCSAVVWGVVVAWVGGSVVRGTRHVNTLLLHRADAAAARGDMRGVSWCHVQGIALSFAAGVLLTAVGVLAGIRLLGPLVRLVPASADRLLILTPAVVLGVGIGAVATLLLQRKNSWALGTGALVGVLLQWLV